MSYIDYRLINLNSTNAIKYNGTMLSNVLFNFKNILKEESDILYSNCGILNAQIPASFYSVNSSNNTLKYTVGASNYTLTIASGNYNANTLITALQNGFSSNSTPITITIDKLNGKLSFSYTSSFSFQFNGSTIFKILGFDPNTNYSSVSNNINGVYPCNLLGAKRINIYSNALANYSIDSFYLTNTSLIQSLSISVPAFGLITYQNFTANYGRLKQRFINEIDIQLFDENNNYLDFNNIDWSITLQLAITRKLVITDTILSIPKINIATNLDNTETKPIQNVNNDLDLLTY